MSSFVLAERLPEPALDAQTPKAIGLQFASVVTAAQAGAEWAWTLLYRSVAPQVLGYLRAQGATDPEDLLGDVFLQLARNLGGFTGDEAGFRSWVFLIAHHRVVDDRRRRRRRPLHATELPDVIGGNVEDDALDRLLTGDVLASLDALTPEQRDVVLLRVFADMSVQDVSTVVRRPVSAVKALQRRGYARLRKALAEKAAANPYRDEASRR